MCAYERDGERRNTEGEGERDVILTYMHSGRCIFVMQIFAEGSGKRRGWDEGNRADRKGRP